MPISMKHGRRSLTTNSSGRSNMGRHCPSCGASWPVSLKRFRVYANTLGCERCAAELERRVNRMETANAEFLASEAVRYEAMLAKAAQRTAEETAATRDSAAAMFP